MPAKLSLFRVIAFACLLVASASSSYAVTPALTFSRGQTWIYEGTVSWQQGTTVKRRRVRVATRVLETFSYPQTFVAVVRSFPSELVWYGDTSRPQYSLLALTSAGLFQLEAESDKAARSLAKDFHRLRQELNTSKDAIIGFPLTEGKPFRSLVAGVRPSRSLTVYRSIHQTNPDHTIIDFVPRLGVVRYIYEHHGTVSAVDVKLVKIIRKG